MVTRDHNLEFVVGLAVILGACLLGGCSESASPEVAGTPAVNSSSDQDPLAEAPEDWQAFLEWAEAHINQSPPPVPLPTDPRLPKPRWQLVRLDELLADAEITCIWQRPETASVALATLGPFKSSLPRPDFRVQRDSDRKLGAGLMLAISGFRVQREEVGSISIEIRVPFGNHFDLIWSTAGRIRVPFPDNQSFWTLNLTTDGLAEWSGSLDRIRLRTDGIGEGEIEIRTLRFLPRQEAFPDATGVRRVNLNRETRNAIYTHCPATLRFSNIELPERAKLQVGLGHVLPNQTRGVRTREDAKGQQDAVANTTDFQVIIEQGGQRTPVLNRSVRPEEHWVDVSVELEAWAGQTVSLILKTSSGSGSSVALWANPVIYEPVDNPTCLVLYLIDTLAAKHMDLYGYERPTTPNISKLAAEGVWFANAFCNSPVTVASVPDILLSMPAERHEVYAASMAAPTELVTVAEVLRAAGFATALFSTNVNAGPRQSMDQGFDYFIDRVGFVWDRGIDRTVPLKEVRDWIETHHDRPMFLYIHTAEPHAPYTPPEGFAGRFDPGYAGAVDGSMGSRGWQTARSERDVAHIQALYDEEVLYADARFGLFRELLGELGLRDQANIVLIADHGEELMEHGHWGHGRSLYTEVLHIPLVAAGPLITARGRVDTPAQLYDVMPTILALLGLPEPYQITGESLRPFLQTGVDVDHQTLEERVIVHSHHRYFGLGIVQYAVIEAARWKLMYFYEKQTSQPDGKATHFELYDLKDFFYDRADVLDEHRDVARRLIGKLIAYRRQQHPYDPKLRAGQLEMDPRQIRELQALGYVGSDEGEEDEDE